MSINKDKLESYFKWGLGAVAIGIGGFAGAFLIKSVVALAVVVVGGLALVNGVPVLAQLMAHGRIKGQLWLARRNPVEELILQYKEKHEILEQTAKAVTEFGRETANYGDKVSDFSRRRPEKAADFKKTFDRMNHVYQLRLQALTRARGELARFEGVIDEARDIWDMTQAAIKANKLLSKFTQGDPMQEIREKTALDSVYGSLNQVMAELDTAMAMDYNALETIPAPAANTTAALANNPSEVIEVTPVTVKETVNVPRTR